MTIRVLIADDQEMVRMGFRMILDAQPDIEVVADVPDGVEAVRKARELRPDVCLLDIRMPGLDGLEVTRQLAGPGVTDPMKVVVVTTFDLDEYVHTALRNGASGFLLKDATPAQLTDAVRTVHGGNAVLAPNDLTTLLEGEFRTSRPLPPAYDRLTDKEREVLLGVARGDSNAEIAASLFVSESTVKTHLGQVLRKLGLRDRVQVAVFAHAHGLVAES